MMATIHGETRPSPSSAISTPETSSLSAVVSRNDPSLVVTFQRRARRPSSQSVAAAMQNSSGGQRLGVLAALRTSAMITGVRTIRTVVPAASRRAERSPPRLMFGVATSVADATARPRRAAQALLHGGDPARRHAELAHAERRPAAARPRGRPRAPRRRRPSGRGARPPRRRSAIRSSTGSRAASSSGASAGLPRSAAIVYCERSLVPIEKKSRCGGEEIGLQRGRRAPRSSRRPRSAPSSRLARAASSSRARGQHLVDGRDHREHHGDGVLGRDAQDRAQLRREEVRVREREAQSAAAEERVRLAARWR